MSRSKVSSLLIETRSEQVSSGRASIPRARSRSRAPTFPGKSRRRSSSSSAASAPIVVDARGSEPSLGARPDARELADVERREERGLASRGGRRSGRPACAGRWRSWRRPCGRDPSEHVRLVAPRTEVCTASATARASPKSGRPRRGRGSPRPSRCARRSARPRARRSRPPASTRSRGRAAAGRRRREGTGAAPPRSSLRSGSRTCGPRSSPSRRLRVRADRRRRRAASRAGRALQLLDGGEEGVQIEVPENDHAGTVRREGVADLRAGRSVQATEFRSIRPGVPVAPIAKPVVQPVVAVLPELVRPRHEAEAAPVGRQGDLSARMSRSISRNRSSSSRVIRSPRSGSKPTRRAGRRVDGSGNTPPTPPCRRARRRPPPAPGDPAEASGRERPARVLR